MKRLVGLLPVVLVMMLVSNVGSDVDARDEVHVSPQTAHTAQAVVNGNVLSTVHVELDGMPHRVSEVEVTGWMKGSTSNTILVEVPGGQKSDGTYYFESHTPDLVEGARVQLALTETPGSLGANFSAAVDPGTTTYSVVSGSAGAYDLGIEGVSEAAVVGDYVPTGVTWSSFSPPPKFYVNTSNSGVSASGTIAGVKRGFQMWEDDPNSTVDFTYGGTTNKTGVNAGDGQIVISWVNPGAGAGWLAKAGWSATGSGDIIGFDVRMNVNFAWANGASSGRWDIGTTVGHEVGHGIGFNHASGSDEIMFGTIFAGRVSTLGPGDRSGVAALYPREGSQFTSPSAGTELCTGDVLRWADELSGGRYKIRLGTSVDGTQIANQTVIGAKQMTVSQVIPNQTIYASVRYLGDAAGSSWELYDQRVFAGCSIPPGEFTTPSPGSQLCAGQTLAWSGPNGGRYKVRLGTSPDSTNIMNRSVTGEKSMTVLATVPNSTVYASLRYLPDGGSWQLIDQTTYAGCAEPVEITAPSSRLCSGDLISWSGPDSGRYKVRIGTSPDGTDVMNRSVTAMGLYASPVPPSTTLYVSLRRQATSSSSWVLHDQVVYQPCANPILIVSPASGAPLCSGAILDWIGTTSGRYKVRIGTSFDSKNILNKGVDGTTQLTLPNLPTAGTYFVSVRHLATGNDSIWVLHHSREFSSC